MSRWACRPTKSSSASISSTRRSPRTSRPTPKFVKKYANVAEIEVAAFKEYVQDVKTGKFPTDDHVYHILKGKEDDFAKMLKEFE